MNSFIPVLFRTGNNRYDPSYHAPFQPHLDPMRVEERAGQDLVYNPPRFPPAALVFFFNNIDC
jgi:hypothetical protein